MNCRQKIRYGGVGVVIQHPHQRNDIRPQGQRIVAKTSRVQADTVGQTSSPQPRARAVQHHGQIEQVQLQSRISRPHRRQKGPRTATHIHQPLDARQIDHPQRVFGHQHLAFRHQIRIGRRHLRIDRPSSPKDIGPKPRKGGGIIAAQKGHGVGQVGVKGAVMLDHLGQSRHAQKRSAAQGQGKAAIVLAG